MDQELEMYKEGAAYFDEDYDKIMDKRKYKHEQLLNTGIWWFRKYKKQIVFFTDAIASTEYLFNVLPKGTSCTIYYHTIASYLNFDEIMAFYEGSDVKFIKIPFIPSETMIYRTIKDKKIPYSTIVLASDNTIIFDKKYLGCKKDSSGDRQVYRIKDKHIFTDIQNRFNTLISVNGN